LNCRFLIGNHSKNVGEGFERLFISSVPLRRASKTTPSLLCIARKIGTTPATLIQSQQGQSTTLYLQQTSSVLPGPLNQQDLFSTRLDPASFRIIFTETDKVSLSARVSGMFGKSFLEFCPQEDQEIIRNHFLETLQSTSDVSYTISKPYSITGLFGSVTDPQQQRSIRVQTRSKYIKSNNHQVIIDKRNGFTFQLKRLTPLIFYPGKGLHSFHTFGLSWRWPFYRFNPELLTNAHVKF